MSGWLGKPRFDWSGRDAQGLPCHGSLQAPSAAWARAVLARQQIQVSRLQRRWGGEDAVQGKDVAVLLRQWAALLQADIRLVATLQMLQSHSAHARGLVAALRAVQREVEQGMALSQAMAQHPRLFGDLDVSLVAAGEAAGILPQMMEKLAHTREKNERLRAQLRAAMVYPCVVMGIAVLVLLVVLLHVVPVFEDVYRSFGAALPWSTQLVLGISRGLGQNALPLLLGAVALAMALRHWARRPQWQRAWQRRLLDWPVIGSLLRTSAVARWAHTLSSLLAAGVPLPEALPVAGQATGHALYIRISVHLQRRVQQGERLSQALAHSGRFGDLTVQMCATGEDSGTLAALLARVADLLSDELDARLRMLSSLLEPAIIVCLGGAIGGILVAMYLPIFQLGQVF